MKTNNNYLLWNVNVRVKKFSIKQSRLGLLETQKLILDYLKNHANSSSKEIFEGS
jgi:hypothetical protein